MADLRTHKKCEPQRRKFTNNCLFVLAVTLFCAPQASAADDLKLRPGISFTQDIESGFPITGTNMEDCKIVSGAPTLIFFGASGDLNTARQAKRLVLLYKKIAPKAIKFIVVDIDHPPNDDAKTLIKTQYHGYIPAAVLVDKSGKVVWNHDGEIELNLLKAQVDKVID